MINAAKSLIEIGLPIIPLCTHDHTSMSKKHIERCKCPGKTPLIKGWQNKNITTEDDLKDWQRSWTSFNIGLPLGDASNYCGIDVDGEKGKELLLEMSNGDIPSTWEFTTGAGHRLLYRIPEGMKTKKFKQTGEGVHEECALLCNGQQTVLPPSIHHTGKQYEWIEGHTPWDMDCALAPQWLLNLIELKDSTPFAPVDFDSEADTSDEFSGSAMSFEVPESTDFQRETKGKTGHNVVITEDILNSDIPEGNRDNLMTQIVGHYCANRDLRRLGKDFVFQVCMKHNLDKCKPPLDEEAIKNKVEYFFTAEQGKEAEFANAKGNKPQFEASKMANIVIERLKAKGIHLHFDQFSKIYYYTTNDQGPWHGTRNYAVIQKWIREVITSKQGDLTWDKRSFVEETRIALEEHFTQPYKKYDDFDLGAHSDELSKYIVVKNGMVDWESGTLLDWDPTYKTTVAFDVEYDKTATCPNWEKYISEWIGDTSVEMVLQEYLGYCLIPNTNFRKALFLYGKGKNGKSILMEFLQDFFGDLATNLSYDGLFQRFGPAMLKDKLVNIFDDTSITFTKETSVAKNLIAGGSISTEFKGKDMFSFQNVSRFIFSSQETPRTSDNTVAWYDRWFFIKFPNSFRPSNKITQEIKRNLEKERVGIFNWMLEGLRRLMSQDDFSNSGLLNKYTLDYQSQNDNVTAFVHNMCVDDSNAEGISINQLYRIYMIWIESEQLKHVSKKVFSQRIEDLGYDRIKGYHDGKPGQSLFKGLALNMSAEGYSENAMEINIELSRKD